MKLKWMAATAAVAGLAAAAYFGALPDLGFLKHHGEKAGSAVTPPPAVSVAKVRTADFVEYVLVSGSIVARNEILVAPEIEGFRVVELLVDEGDVVKKGDVLARLEKEQLAAQMAQNAAALARADAAIAQARSQIVENEAKLVEAKAQLERAKSLKQSGNIAESVYDQRDATAKTTQAQLVASRDGLRVAEAEKVQADAQRRELAWRLSNTEVKAPADGIISRRNARVGALATSVADPLFKMVEKGEIELDGEVPESQLPKLADGQNARVAVAGVEAVDGKVRLISPEVDRTTRLGRVRIFLGSHRQLRVGAFGRGSVETARGRGLAVPVSALVHTEDSATVQVVIGDRVATRIVKTGLVSGGLAEIREGLSESDVVVARAGSFLRDGDPVRPINPEQNTLSEAK